MSPPFRLRSRAPALLALAALGAPLVGAAHHHEVDHDGATHHIEAAHGSHAPAVTETNDRLTSGTPRVPLAPVATQIPGASLETHSDAPDVAGEQGTPSSRAPPGAPRSRAPPSA